MTISLVSSSQIPSFQWARQLRGVAGETMVRGNSVVVDDSGNVYSTGYFFGKVDFDPGYRNYYLVADNNSDIFVTKLDPAGNLIWVCRFGGRGEDIANSMALDSTGNLYIVGNYSDTVDFDPGPGNFNLTSHGKLDVFILKLDLNGNLIWVKQSGGKSKDYATCINSDDLGNIHVTGQFSDTVDFDPGSGVINLVSYGESDAFILKLNYLGNFIWATNVGGKSQEGGNFIAIDDSNNMYITGYFFGTADFNPGIDTFKMTPSGGADIFILKLDKFGKFIFALQIGGTSYNFGASLVFDDSGNVYVSGLFQGTADIDPGPNIHNVTSEGQVDIFILKISPPGNLVWAKNIGGTGSDFCYSIVRSSNHLYITGGYDNTVDFDPGPSSFYLKKTDGDGVFVLKLDLNGNFGHAIKFGGRYAFSMAIDRDGTIYTTGTFQGKADFDYGQGLFYLSSQKGYYDGFVHKMGKCAPPIAPVNSTQLYDLNICYNAITTITAAGWGILKWYPTKTGGKSFNSGSYLVTDNLTKSTSFFVADSTCVVGPRLEIKVKVNPEIKIDLKSQTDVSCHGGREGSIEILANGGSGYFKYIWDPISSTTSKVDSLYAGIYYCYITDSNYCSLLKKFTISEPQHVDVLTSINGSTITALIDAKGYQWLDCDNGRKPLQGEINKQFKATKNGNYAVVVINKPCYDTSDCINISSVGIGNVSIKKPLYIFPNPAKAFCNIQTSVVPSQVVITDLLGNKLLSFIPDSNDSIVNLDKFDNGVYLIIISFSDYLVTKKIEVLR